MGQGYRTPQECSDVPMSVEEPQMSMAEPQMSMADAVATQTPGVAGPAARPDNSTHLGWYQDPNAPLDLYMHASNNSDQYNENLEVGLGMLHGPNGDVMSANAQLGVWGDEKGQRIGARGNAQMAKGNAFSQENGLGVEGSVFSAGAEMSAGSDGATIGAGASVIDGAVTVGGFNRDDSWADSQVRGGLGFGVGAAGRLHWSDTDQDGVEEVGFGFDAGPVSFDVKSEAPTQLGNFIGDSWADAMGHNSGGGGTYHDADAYQAELDDMAWYAPWTW